MEMECKDTKNPVNNSLKNTKSDEDLDSDQKYLDLIDLLTVKMFQSDTDSETKNNDVNSKPKKSNSLPRCFDKPDASLQKSSSQTLLSAPPTRPGPTQPGQQLTAYERLFGVSSP